MNCIFYLNDKNFIQLTIALILMEQDSFSRDWMKKQEIGTLEIDSICVKRELLNAGLAAPFFPSNLVKSTSVLLMGDGANTER